ncbi:MAG: hypothetical protein R2874_07100 [Desulfobacterales bacterium]
MHGDHQKTWPAMAGSFSDKQHTAIHQISEKTYDIHQFLVDVIGVVPVFAPSERGLKPIVTWHDPCHLKKPRTLPPPHVGWFRQMRHILLWRCRMRMPVAEWAAAST